MKYRPFVTKKAKFYLNELSLANNKNEIAILAVEDSFTDFDVFQSIFKEYGNVTFFSHNKHGNGCGDVGEREIRSDRAGPSPGR